MGIFLPRNALFWGGKRMLGLLIPVSGRRIRNENTRFKIGHVETRDVKTLACRNAFWTSFKQWQTACRCVLRKRMSKTFVYSKMGEPLMCRSALQKRQRVGVCVLALLSHPRTPPCLDAAAGSLLGDSPCDQHRKQNRNNRLGS